MNRNIFLILGIVLFISFTSATDYLPHKINTTLEFSFTDDIALSCNVSTMSIPNGSVIWINQEMDNTGDTFYAIINEGNFSELGVYCFNIECEDGYGDVCREVTNSGEIASGSKIALSIVLLIILVFFFILSINGLFKVEDYKGKFALYWTSHILMVGITFVAWTTAHNFLNMDGGITGVFKVLFYFFIISVFPMILFSMGWIIYIHSFNEHFQKMVDKGHDTETAFRLTKKKRGGWFVGQ